MRGSFRVLSVILGLAAVAFAGSCRKEAPAPAPAAEAATPAGAGKIPVTTASDEAKNEFLQGRALAENLRITDSIPHFQKAASLDPNFASAELNLATSAPTGTEFFQHLDKAVALADKVSNGERLLILATKSGANNDNLKQKEYLEQLVAAYPNDERAHFNLGGYYFAQQDVPRAIDHYKRATELEPAYATAYNILGYAYRQNEDYANAERAFQRYIELIPKDPNPYDSYAELLLKMGRYDDSIAQYRKALDVDPNFVNAHQGIAMDLLYQGKSADAATELAALQKKARTDAEHRTALFALTVVHVDSGQTAKALADVDAQYALGEKSRDALAMAGDDALKGNILLEAGKPDAARAQFAKAVEVVEASDLSPELKANTKLVHHYNLTLVAVAKNDLAAAKREAQEYGTGASVSKNPFQRKFPHELAGIIALAEKDWEKAIAELQQANQQNAYNLYRLGLAYRGKGDAAKAKELFTKAANFNSLPAINYAFIRSKAIAAAGGTTKG